jgi:hypothetical protein
VPLAVSQDVNRPATGSQSLERRRPATVARGNARPLEEPPSTPRPGVAPLVAPATAAPSWQEATGEISEFDRPDHTRVEAQLPRPMTPSTPAPPPQAQPPRQPTVQVGGGGVGVRSKRVVPLDEPKR